MFWNIAFIPLSDEEVKEIHALLEIALAGNAKEIASSAHHTYKECPT
jgi:hypothetical protein